MPSMEITPTFDSASATTSRLPTRYSAWMPSFWAIACMRRARTSPHMYPLREDLLRVEHPGGIEAVLETGHGGEVVGGVNQGHVPALLGADAVLSGECAADVDAVGDDLFARFQYALGRAADAAIEEHQGMQFPSPA